MVNRRMPRWCLVAVVAVLGCAASDALGSSSPAEYQLILHADSAAVYGCNQSAAVCSTCTFYCFYYVPQSDLSAGTLDVDSRHGTAVFNSNSGTVSTAGAATTVFVRIPPYCESYSFTGTLTSNQFHGTWSHQLDCHALNVVGTFTGTR